MKPQAILLVLFALILHGQCSSISDLMRISSPKTSFQMNAIASSSSGEIPILKDLDGFYVNADLVDSPSSTNDTVKMMLGLTSSDTLLIQQDCLDFKQYSCPYYHCTKYPNNQQTISYPDFTANTIQASAYVSLDHTYWELQGKALLATSCSTKRTDMKGNNRYGVIGVGTQGSSKGNFLKSKTFSIHFPSSDVKNGTLKFSPKELDGFYFLTYFTTNANWIVPMKGYLQFSGFSEGFTGSMIFDINADAIGFPPRIFELFIRTLEEKQWMQGMSCTKDVFQPTCNYTGYIRDLTEIDISAGQPQNNGRRFDIKPELYVMNVKSKDDYVYSITLNLQALNASLSSGKSYVTEDYENTIVLDARAMSYFYLIFNATGNTNTISVYNVQGILPNGTSPDSIFNLSKYSGRDFVIIGFILLVSLTVRCAILKKCNGGKNGRVTQASPVIIIDNTTTIVNAGVQNNFYQQQPRGVQYIPPQNVGYIYQENQHL